MHGTRVFKGIRVVDFSWYAVGPQTARHLADNGAEVIRVESSANIDLLRVVGPFKDGVWGEDNSGYFANQNANKYSFTLNLKKPKAVEIAKRLVAVSDVVLESFTPGIIEKFGLSYDDLKAVKPDIIMISMSAQGRNGPYSNHPSYGHVLQALAGVNHLTGWPDGDPIGAYGPYTDFFVPHMAAAAVIAALDYRRRTGIGQYIELSQLETAIHCLDTAIIDYTVNGRVQQRQGNRHPYASPHGAYPCKGEDRWCAIAVFTDEEWEHFLAVLGNPEWGNEERFQSPAGRVENAEELDILVAEWTVNHTPEDVMAIMQANGIACGVIQNAKDLHADPQLKHRNHYWVMDHPVMGKTTYDSPAYMLSKTPSRPRMPSPLLGQHVEFICSEILNMSDEELVECMAEGVFE
ncbi:MAG: CoA transferase [Desulfobacterales bacterium]